jgi:hypothetical protein
VNRREPGKHRLFCNPEKRGVTFIAGLAAAADEMGEVRTREGTRPRFRFKPAEHELTSGGDLIRVVRRLSTALVLAEQSSHPTEAGLPIRGRPESDTIDSA